MGKHAKVRKNRTNAKLALLDLFVETAAPIFKEALTPDCCVNGTRIAIEVLMRLGLNPRPMVTHATAMNSAFWALIKASDGWPSQEVLDVWVKDHDAWAVGVGGGLPNMPGYDAHLVVVVLDHLLDSASGQFSRPAKKILAPPMIVAPVDKLFLAGKVPTILGSGDLRHGIVSYMAKPEDRSYESVPGFAPHPRNMHVAKQVFEAMHARVQE